MRGLPILAAALLAALPPTVAEDPALVAPSQRLVPGVPAPLELRFTVDCNAAVRWASTDGRLHYDAQWSSQASTLTVAGPAQVVLDPSGCTEGTLLSATAQATVAATPGTPALQPMAVAARLTPTTDLPGVGPSPPVVEGRAQVTVQGIPSIAVEVPVREAAAGPQKAIVYAIHVKNTGNCEAIVTFDLAVPPEDEEWRSVILPAPLPLGPAWGPEGGKDVATFVVNTPYHNGPNDGAADFTVRATPFCSMDLERTGDPQEVQLHAESHGMYIPGPSSAVPLVAMAALALAARRRA